MLQSRALNIVIIIVGVAALLIAATFASIRRDNQQNANNVENSILKNENSSLVAEDEFTGLQEYKISLSEKTADNEAISEFGERTVFSWCGGCLVFKEVQAGTNDELNPPEYRLRKNEKKDLSGDNIDEEYALDKGKLIIKQGDKLIWQSDDEWWVDDFFLADSTGDGMEDINFSVWKAGNYGSSHPFWEEENDMSVKNHFFVFGFKDDSVQAIWQSSNLDNPNCEFTFTDVDSDSQQELVVIEGEYNDDWVCQGKFVAVWQWQEWGFFKDWRSQAGIFKDLEIVEKNSEFYITVAGN